MINNYGAIRFDSEPENIDVYLNGEHIGVTPLDAVDVNPGIYSYSMKKDEEHQFLSELQVKQRKITHIIADFTISSINKEYIDITDEESPFPKTVSRSKPDSPKRQTESSSKEQPIPTEEQPSSEEYPISTESSSKEQQPEGQSPEGQSPEGQSPEEQSPEEQPPEEEEEVQSPTEQSTLDKHLEEMNKILSKNNDILESLNQEIVLIHNHMIDESGHNPDSRYFTTGQLAIRVATPNRPETSDIIADPNTSPPTPGYDRIAIHDLMLRLSPDIAVVNDGSTLLYIVVSHDGKTYSTAEVTLMRGEIKHFYNIYELRIRGPAVGNLNPDIATQPGGIYRATEYPSRFDFYNINKSAIAVATSLPIPIVGAGFTLFVFTGDIINLTSVLRSRVTNTDNVYYTSLLQDITDDTQRGILAPGDVLRVSGTRGMQIIFAGNSPGQIIEATSETDLI